MDQNTPNPGALTENGTGIGPVSRQMIEDRAAELALINGRTADEVTKADLAQARRELNGGPDLSDQTLALEAAPESDRWNPVPGSPGHQAPETPDEDEDAEGLSEEAQLVEEGVREATHDQMLQAARLAKKAAPGDSP